MRLVRLLSSLNSNINEAIPAMARTLKDEDRSVRHLAIGFFTQNEDNHTPLNQMEPKAKQKLLPEFIRAMQESDWSLRNNAVIALRYYPEAPQIVVPVLVNAMKDPVPRIRQLVAESLHRVDPDTLARAGAIPMLIGVLKDADDQIAYRAAELLGKLGKEPELVVPALIAAAQSTNNLVARTALESLGNFPNRSQTIVPVLQKALESSEGLVRWSAAAALKKIGSTASATTGLQRGQGERYQAERIILRPGRSNGEHLQSRN